MYEGPKITVGYATFKFFQDGVDPNIIDINIESYPALEKMPIAGILGIMAACTPFLVERLGMEATIEEMEKLIMKDKNARITVVERKDTPDEDEKD